MIKAETTINLSLFKMPLQLKANVSDTTLYEAYSDFDSGQSAPDLDKAIEVICKQLNIDAFLETELKIDAVFAQYNSNTKRFYAEGVINLPNAKAALILNFEPSKSNKNENNFAVVLDLNFVFDLKDLPVIPTNEIDENLRLSLAFANYSGTFQTIPFGDTSKFRTRKIIVQSGIQLQPNIKLPKENFDFNYELVDFQPKQAATVDLSKNLTSLPKLPTSKGTKWFDLNQSIGGLTLRKIGMQWQKSKATILLNLDYLSNGLAFSILGLKASSPLSLKNFKPNFDLHGVGVHYKNDFVELGGALLKNDTIPKAYIGKMLMRLAQFNIGAIGGFSKSDTGENSFFAFANTNLPIGGIPAFFITGISAGFGYNTNLNLPKPNQIANFPLLNMITTGEKNPSEALAALDSFISEKINEKWLAAGVNFTSFQLIKGNLILAYEFAKKQLSILGIARLILPTEKAAYLNLQFGLKSIYSIKQGEIQSNTQLQDGSFLIHKNVNLSGNLAIYTWLKGEHSGDFVLTIGGYHPKFQRPEHFPKVPKVGFNWKVSETTKIEGNVYFALTNQAIMTGFSFDATYEKGRLKAYFKASSDMILQWKPFYYDFQTKVRLGANYQSRFLKNYKLDIGANLHLFGPETAGFIQVNWSIISFNIKIGNPEKTKFIYVLDWESFYNTFLPLHTKDLLKININQNTINHSIDINTQSLIPSNNLVINNLSIDKTDNTFGIRPMNKQQLDSTQSIKIIHQDTKEIFAINYKFIAKRLNFPAAIWSAKPLNTKALNNETVTAISGFDKLELVGQPDGNLAAIDTKYFDNQIIKNLSKFNKETKEIGAIINQEKTTIANIANTINSNKTVQNRQEIINTLNQFLSNDHSEFLPNQPLKKLAKNAERIFQSEPKLGSINTGKIIKAKAKTTRNTKQKNILFIDKSEPKLLHFSTSKQNQLRIPKRNLNDEITSRSIQATAIDKKVKITLGAVYVFDFQEKSTEKKIEFSSIVNIQIIEFDVYNNLIKYHILDNESTYFFASKNTKRLAIKGIALTSEKPKYTGWKSSEDLPLINSNALLGKAFYLKTQVPIQEDNRISATVAQLEKQNYIQTKNGHQKGFIDTLVFKDYREIILILTPKNQKDLNLDYIKNNVELSIPFVYKNGFKRQLSLHKIVLNPRNYLIDKAGNIRLKFRLSNKKMQKKSKDDESWNGFVLRLKINEYYHAKALFLFEKRVKKSIWESI